MFPVHTPWAWWGGGGGIFRENIHAFFCEIATPAKNFKGLPPTFWKIPPPRVNYEEKMPTPSRGMGNGKDMMPCMALIDKPYGSKIWAQLPKLKRKFSTDIAPH